MWFSEVKFSTADLEKTQRALSLFGASNESHPLVFEFANSSRILLEVAEKNALTHISFSNTSDEFKKIVSVLKEYATASPDSVKIFDDCAIVDIDGIKFTFKVSSELLRRRVSGYGVNTPTNIGRLNTRVQNSQELEYGLGHIAIYVSDLEKNIRLLTALGFCVSDETIDRNVFLRLGTSGWHHSLLLVHDTFRAGTLHHLAVMTNDTYSVFNRGAQIAEAGFETMMGPGRHNISSGTFWYFHTPIGALELSSDMDYIRPSKRHNWSPQKFSADTLVINHWVVTSDGRFRINHAQFLESKKE